MCSKKQSKFYSRDKCDIPYSRASCILNYSDKISYHMPSFCSIPNLWPTTNIIFGSYVINQNDIIFNQKNLPYIIIMECNIPILVNSNGYNEWYVSAFLIMSDYAKNNLDFKTRLICNKKRKINYMKNNVKTFTVVNNLSYFF